LIAAATCSVAIGFEPSKAATVTSGATRPAGSFAQRGYAHPPTIPTFVAAAFRFVPESSTAASA
jgi:hypothetical protein